MSGQNFCLRILALCFILRYLRLCWHPAFVFSRSTRCSQIKNLGILQLYLFFLKKEDLFPGLWWRRIKDYFPIHYQVKNWVTFQRRVFLWIHLQNRVMLWLGHMWYFYLLSYNNLFLIIPGNIIRKMLGSHRIKCFC